MHFKIIFNKGTEEYIKAKSKAMGDLIENRLRIIKLQGRIRGYERLSFRSFQPDDVLKIP
jgi:hypothetical protein